MENCTKAGKSILLGDMELSDSGMGHALFRLWDRTRETEENRQASPALGDFLPREACASTGSLRD